MSWCKKYQSSFNGYPIERPGKVSRPERYAELKPGQLTSIARGLGASYGDAALNAHGEIILTHRLDRLLKFDTHQGILSVEAGITLEKILKWSVKQGWFLPVIPGTAEVTLGGCIATDIHGKNHKDAGSLGQHILHLQLITASGKKINCSPQVMPELFWATIGGMGLTGIIGEATLQLKRIETAYMKVQVQAISRLKQIIEKLGQGENEFDYNVAWLDMLNKPFFHGLLIKAKHATLSELSDAQQKKPFLTSKYARLNCPSLFSYSVLHPRFVQWFNKAYYHLAKKNQFFLQAYHDYFFPLDRLKNWPRLYGKRGFIQYQCVIPTKFSYVAIHEILEILQRNKQPIYLAVLKYFGQENLAPLSFPLPGFTLALDIPIRGDQLFECLNKLDEIVIQTGGRIYLAKDARLNPEAFRAMYKRYPEWLTVKRHWDPQDKMSSSLSRRLNLGF
ncbi:FAD-binding oxidoreductase [Rickettsiella grylli]|uniref:Oxidoreductase, FAD-binding n=1 Tax=Rickettsiella grylli TaxID=59196 RepID=A8PQD5_9COXI|nr:FAD-binding oxidoreductase [Rickettsiella grylli]EDP46375.1 oxidoreductase, FAD-binding [Rickettsiella grylli]